jgi:hypothetical protein
MSIVRQVEEALTKARTDGFLVENAGEGVAEVRYSGPRKLAPRRLHEYAGPLRQAGFEVDPVDLPEYLGMPERTATGRRNAGGGLVGGPDPHLRVTARGRLLRLGCLGVIGLMVLLVAIAMFAPRQQPQPQISEQPAGMAGDKPSMAQIGQTVSLGGWEVTLVDFGPYDHFAPSKPPATKARGALVVADMQIKNLQNSTSNFTTNDFTLRAGDGREFKPVGQTTMIDRGFTISQTVQPGLRQRNRVVFDVDPNAPGPLIFTALRTQFEVPHP